MAFKSFCESQPPVTHTPSPPPVHYPPAHQTTTTNIHTTNVTNIEYNNTVITANNNTTNNYIVHESYENTVHYSQHPSDVTITINNDNSTTGGTSIENNSETNSSVLSNNLNGNEILNGNSITTGDILSPSLEIGDVDLGLLENVNVLNGATTTVLGAPLVSDVLNGGILNGGVLNGDLDLLSNLVGDVGLIENTGTLIDASGLLQNGVDLDLLSNLLNGDLTAPVNVLTDLVDADLDNVISAPVDIAASLLDTDVTSIVSAPLEALTGDLLTGDLTSVIAAPVEVAEGLLGGDVTTALNAPLEIAEGVLGGDLVAVASAPLDIVAPVLSNADVIAPVEILSDLTGNIAPTFDIFDGVSFGDNLISALTSSSSIEGLDIASIATDVTSSPLTLVNAFTDADLSNALSQLNGIGGGANLFDLDLSSLGATIMESMLGDSGSQLGGLSGIITQIDLFDIGDFGHGAHSHG